MSNQVSGSALSSVPHLQEPNLVQTVPEDVQRTPLAPASFSVSARVAMQLGRESISSSNTAIIELVKNAYDADAEVVSIWFAGLGTPTARMVIEDNGHGMTESELRQHWLCIGTDNKQQAGKSSSKKRIQTGEKGLGRLGLDRLCRRTILQSVRYREPEPGEPAEMFPQVKSGAIELDIFWDRYQAAGQRLETIEHKVTALEHLNFDPVTLEPRPFLKGTRLILEGLKDDWSRERLRELCDELSLLLSPFGRPEDFKIELNSGCGWDDVDGQVHPPVSLLDLANWKVEATIEPIVVRDSSGHERVADERVRICMTSAQHERAYLPPAVLWSDFTRHKGQTAEPTQRLSGCGPLKFEFHVFIRDADELAKSGSGLSEIRDFLLSNRGIRIYRDGFRVKPFGDPAGEYDWLTLSLRRATNPAAISRANWKVAYHQVVGAVFISRLVNPSLIDQTNREGLVEGKAFDDLRLFASKVIQYFEGRAHEDSEKQKPPPEKEPAPEKPSLDTAADVLDEIEAAVRQLKPPAQAPLGPEPTKVIEAAVPRALAALGQAQREIEDERRRNEESLEALREEMVVLTSLASLGIMTASFGHERVNDATEVLNDAARLRKHIDNPQGSLFSKEERLQMLDHLLAGAQRVDTFARFALDHIRPWKRQKEPVRLRKVVERTLTAFDELLCGRFGAKVEPDLAGGADHAVPGWEAGWESVLVNLISNASWALSTKRAEQRRIRVALHVEGSEVVLTFEDSGIGLEAGTEEDIFRPGVSTKRDDRGRQIGTGMGLTIVRSFVTMNRGTIRASASPALSGARFEIRVPRVNVPE
jgi:signal transduction histidine kinase